MAISRSQMQRQLQNRGGITNLSPRQNFGLGSSLKKFVRKIIPNEVSKVATAAAPFVAPFNPALAGAMAGIGSFDQSGSLSDALKSIIKSLLITEDANSGTEINITLVDSSAAIFNIVKDKTISAKATEQILTEPLIMMENEILKVQATQANELFAIASILEMNRDDN